MPGASLDVPVFGGGVLGLAVARELAGRGASTSAARTCAPWTNSTRALSSSRRETTPRTSFPPAVARVIAGVVVDGKVDPAHAALDAGRFEDDRLLPEPQLV